MPYGSGSHGHEEASHGGKGRGSWGVWWNQRLQHCGPGPDWRCGRGMAGEFQKWNSQSSYGDRALWRCCHLPWRCDPWSPFRPYLRISGHAGNRCSWPYKAFKWNLKRKTASEKDRDRSCKRLQLLRKPDWTGNRICKGNLSPELCGKENGNRCCHWRCPKKECHPGNFGSGRLNHSPRRPYRTGWLRRSYRLLKGPYGSLHWDLRSRGPERECTNRT